MYSFGDESFAIMLGLSGVGCYFGLGLDVHGSDLNIGASTACPI